MHRTTRSTTSKETTTSNEKTGTQKIIHHSNEGSCSETKITKEVPSENDHVIPKTTENNPDTAKKEKTADTEIIGYVESVSPSKRNRKNTTDYCQTLHCNYTEEKDEELSVSQRRKDYFSQSKKTTKPK